MQIRIDMRDTRVIGRHFRSLARQLRSQAVILTVFLLIGALSAWAHLVVLTIMMPLWVAVMVVTVGFQLAAGMRRAGRGLTDGVVAVEFTDHGVDLTADQASLFVGWPKLRQVRFGRRVVMFVSPFGSIPVVRDAVTDARLSEVCGYLRDAGVAMRGRLPREPVPAEADRPPSL